MRRGLLSAPIAGESAKDIMNTPKTISEDSKISETVKKLDVLNISRLLVEDKVGNHVGIVSTKDWAFFFFDNRDREGISNVMVAEIMKDIIYVKETTSIPKCAALMLDKEISSLAVGSSPHFDGIFTKTDLARYYISRLPYGHRKVDDYMTSNFLEATSDENAFVVLQKMIENKVSRIIIVNPDRTPRGIVTLGDFMSPFYFKKDVEPSLDSFFTFEEKLKIADIMTKDLITVQQDDDMTIACKTILDNHINGVGVLEKDGSLYAVLSKTDITRAVAAMN